MWGILTSDEIFVDARFFLFYLVPYICGDPEFIKARWGGLIEGGFWIFCNTGPILSENCVISFRHFQDHRFLGLQKMDHFWTFLSIIENICKIKPFS